MNYSYTVSNTADHFIFLKICFEIEKNIIGSFKEQILVDVDGSEIQKYLIQSYNIVVVNDYEIDAVYIDSDLNLDKIIKPLIKAATLT